MALNLGLGGIQEAFSSRNFRIYWTGNLTHTITVWVNRMALAWLTWSLTHSTAWLGIIAACQMLPSVFIGPIAGVTADRFGHRFQLVVSTYCGSAIAAVLTAMVAADVIEIEVLAVLVALTGVTRAFNVPARQAMIPTLVERRYISSAVGINGATFHGGNFVGPAIGGGLIATVGIQWAFFAYCAGEFVAATSFLLLRIQERPRKGVQPSLVADLITGARYTMEHVGIRSLMILTAITAMLIAPYLDMLAGFAAQVFHRGPDGLALLTSSTGAGAMIGGLWIARRGRTEGLVRIQLTALALGASGVIAFVSTDILPVSMAALVVCGFCLVTTQVCGSSLIQNAVEPELRARVVSFNGVIGIAGPSFGAMLIGWTATHLGLRLPMGISAACALLVLASVARLVMRNASALEAQAAAGASRV